jgi:4-amino-4-deoxy-L-arabinose transferase-like glycosyltransferase
VAAVLALGWLVRVLPGPGHYAALPLDYDEGVHFAASALLWGGVLPYRDFVFTHPPGLLYALGPVALLDPPLGLTLGRWAATLLGVLNLWLVMRLAGRLGGGSAALAAGLFYALFPEAVQAERRILLEPLLNALCLGSALVGLGERDGERPGLRLVGAGALAGAALAVKATALLWLAGLAAAQAGLPRAGRRVLLLVAGAALAWTVLVGPLALAGGAGFWRDVVLFQVGRPPDSDHGWLGRAVAVFAPALGTALWALMGLASGSGPEQRLAAWAWLFIGTALLLAPNHWSHYNAQLAVPECLLAGAGFAWLKARRPARAAGLLALALVASLGLSLVMTARQGDPGPLQRAALVRSRVPPTASLFAFEPGEGLLAGRLPDHSDGAPPVVDSYAVMLLGALGSGEHPARAEAAFASPGARQALAARLERSRFLLLGPRGRRQMDPEELSRSFVPVEGELWRRR